jgi:hypothetical protein
MTKRLPITMKTRLEHLEAHYDEFYKHTQREHADAPWEVWSDEKRDYIGSFASLIKAVDWHIREQRKREGPKECEPSSLKPQ